MSLTRERDEQSDTRERSAVGVFVAIGLVAAAGLVAVVAGAPAVSVAQETPSTFVVQQGDTCTGIQPLGNGTQSIEEFYDYQRFNQTANYSSLGTIELQRNHASQVFVYHGTDGLSLVFLHGRVNAAGGMVATANLSGLPAAGQPAVEDDGYDAADDVFEYNSTGAHIEWFSNGGRTDGWAYSGLESTDYREITVDMTFNDATGNAPFEKWEPGVLNRIERFFVRSGTGETTELAMNQPFTIGPGTCERGFVTNTEMPTPATTTTTATVDERATGERSTTTASPRATTTRTPTPVPTETAGSTRTTTPTTTATPTRTMTETVAPGTVTPETTPEPAPTATSMATTETATVTTITTPTTASTGTADDGTTTTGTGEGFGVTSVIIAVAVLVSVVALSRRP